VTARPLKRLAQLLIVSQALASPFQKHRSKTSKLIRFGCLHFRDNWGWTCTLYGGWYVVNLFKQKVVSQKILWEKNFLLLPWHYTIIFFVINSLTIVIAQIIHFHPHMYWGYSLADQNVLRLEKMFSTKYHPNIHWAVGLLLLLNSVSTYFSSLHQRDWCFFLHIRSLHSKHLMQYSTVDWNSTVAIAVKRILW